MVALLMSVLSLALLAHSVLLSHSGELLQVNRSYQLALQACHSNFVFNLSASPFQDFRVQLLPIKGNLEARGSLVSSSLVEGKEPS